MRWEWGMGRVQKKEGENCGVGKWVYREVLYCYYCYYKHQLNYITLNLYFVSVSIDSVAVRCSRHGNYCKNEELLSVFGCEGEGASLQRMEC